MTLLRLRPSGFAMSALVSCLGLGLLAAAGAPAEGSPGPVATRAAGTSACQVRHTVAERWPGGYAATVTLTLPGGAAPTWSLGWSYPGGQLLTQAWGARVTQAGTQVLATGRGPSSGGSVTFGVTGLGGAAAASPAGFTLDGAPCGVAGAATGFAAPAAVAAVDAQAASKVSKKCKTRKNGSKTCKTITKKTKSGKTTSAKPTTSTSSSAVVVYSAGFEGGTTDGWVARGSETLAVTTSSAHSGQQSLQVSGRTAAWNGPARDLTSVLLPGRTYTVTAWARLASGTAATTVNLTAERTAGGTTTYDHLTDDVAATDQSWSKLTGTYTVPSGVETLRLYAESPSDVAGFLLDDVTVTGEGGPTTTSTAPTTTTTTTTRSTTTTTTTSPTGNWPPSSTYTNPVLWEDLADLDIVRVGDTYYYSSSNMHYSPGAPILRSYDLVNWEYAGHSLPKLDFGSKYDMSGGRAYVKGTWASFLNYRPSNKTFYWGGCIEFGKSYIYTATSVEGPWNRLTTINKCYYDAGMMVDDDDTMYIAYGNSQLSVAQLSADGKSEVRSQQVFSTPSDPGTLEGSRMFKRNGAYYIFVTKPANGQYILKSTNGPFGPYTMRKVLLNLSGPISGGGVPHQGQLVQTQTGQWYYMAFIDAYPGGRVPALAPVTWTSDGWPELQTVNGAWGASYPYPNVPRPPRTVASTLGTDTFSGSTLGPQWEWNHNPDDTKWSVGNGLTLQAATVTNDLYSARNTLTHRIRGPISTATIELDYSTMRDGDRAGLAALRQSSAWIGLVNDGGTTKLVMTNGLTMDGNWNTTGTGTAVASTGVFGGKVWLRATADIAPRGSKTVTFRYSTDGVNFQQLGSAFTMNSDWQFFMGYRFGIFNYATKSLGGSVNVKSFTITAP